MHTIPKVSFISMRNGNAFNDYYLQISDIFVCTHNLTVLAEALNDPSTKYGDSAFSLSGDGFKGIKISLRMLKKEPILNDAEIVKYVQDVLAKVHTKLRSE